MVALIETSPDSPSAAGEAGLKGPPQLALPALLGLANRVVTEAVHVGLDAQGFADVRPTHGYMFSLLAVRGGTTGVEIAAHLGITKQSAKVLVDQLESAGYVTRQRVARDRRARLIQLTDRAWECIEVGTRLWAEAETALEARVGPDAVATTRRTLEQLVAHLSSAEAVPLRPPR